MNNQQYIKTYGDERKQMSGIYNTNYSAIEESTQQNHRSNIIDIVENCEIIKKKKKIHQQLILSYSGQINIKGKVNNLNYAEMTAVIKYK